METKKIHQIDNVEITGNELKLTIDGKEYTFLIVDISKKLSDADDAQKRRFDISPSGYGIHWPDIDEDLSIDSLIGTKNPVEKPPSHGREAV